MNDPRPVFLSLASIDLPIAALTSILHRVSGVCLFLGSAYLLFLFVDSIESESAFNATKEMLQTPIHSFVLWATLTALGFHFVAGVRHLLMDLHIGETLKVGRASGVVALTLGGLLSVLSGVWLWL